MLITDDIATRDHARPRASWIAIGSLAAGAFSPGMQAISLQSWLLAKAADRSDGIQALIVSLTQLAIGLGAWTGGLVVDRDGSAGGLVLGSLAALATLAIAVATGSGQVRKLRS